MTFGLSPFGLSPFGGGSDPVSVASAWALSTRSICVNVTAVARALDAFDAGDALNPSTWIVTRLDAMTNLTPLYVQRLSSTSFEVTVMEELGSHMVEHRIGSTTLISAMGSLITMPYQATFMGVAVAIDTVGAVRRRPLVRDLANPYRSNALTGQVASAILTSGGDYETEVDAAVVRKGLLRRLTTPRGSIRALPNYGIGFAVKSLLPNGGDREALRVEVENPARQEPGVKKARATIRIVSRGVVSVRVDARMSSAQLAVTVRRDSDGNFLEL